MAKKLKKVKPGHVRVTPLDNRYMSSAPYVNDLTNLPEWFRRIPKGKGSVRACVGITDFLGTGFTIPAWTNFSFKPRADMNEWEMRADNMNPGIEYPMLGLFGYEQTGECPMTRQRELEKMPYPKLITPWRIQTAPGWSCLMLPILYDQPSEYTILPAVIHTDFYQIMNVVVNPLTGSDFSIKYGTPLVHIIPFKRDSDITKIDFEDESFFKYASSNMYLTGGIGPASGTGAAYRRAVRVVDSSIAESKNRIWQRKR